MSVGNCQRRSAIVIIMSLVCGDTRAESANRFFSGNDWAPYCYARNYTALTYYLSGIADAEAAATATGQGASFCLPARITGEQLDDIFCEQLKTHPEQRHFDAGFLATNAIRNMFPCP